MNVVVLRGTVPRDPEARELSSGDQVVNFDLSTRAHDGRATQAPIAWIDPPASVWTIGQGDEVVVIGHVRRRFFKSASGLTSRTEVMAEHVLKPGTGKRARTAIEKAAEVVLNELVPTG